MNSHPFRQIAAWLIERFAETDLIEPLVGDLIEQHHDGRSSVWFWRQVLILLFGGRTMVRFGVTLLSIVFLIVVTTRMALAGLLHPSDWHTSLLMLESYICLIVLLLLIQRAVWRSSPTVLRSLTWPTAIGTAIVGLGGIATSINDVRLGAYVLLISFLATYALWRTSERKTASA